MSKKAVFVFLVVSCACVVFFLSRYMRNDSVFMYAGTIETSKIVLSSKINADIVSLPVDEGQSVKRGDVIARLDDDPFRIAAKQLNADYDRYLRLRSKGTATQEGFDRIARLKEENDLKLVWCRIESPVDGVVVTKFKEEKEYVNVGSSIVSIADLSNAWAYFYVPYDAVHKLKVGGEVVGFLQEAPGKVFPGSIVKINEEAEFTPKNVQTREERTRLVYGVKVKFDNKALELKAGMTMEISF